MDSLIQKSANTAELTHLSQMIFKQRDPKLTPDGLDFFVGRVQDRSAVLGNEMDFDDLLSLLSRYRDNPMVQVIGKFSERWSLVERRGEGVAKLYLFAIEAFRTHYQE